MSRESPIVEILQFIAARPDGLSTRGADIPGLDAAGGRACGQPTSVRDRSATTGRPAVVPGIGA